MTKKIAKKLTLGGGVDHHLKALTAPPKKKIGRPATGQLRHDPTFKPFTLYLKVATKREAKAKADRAGRPLSAVVEDLFSRWVAAS